MHPWVLTKLSYGILKESLLHPKAILVLDKTSGKVSRRDDNGWSTLEGLSQESDQDLEEIVNIYRQYRLAKGGEKRVHEDMGSGVSVPTCPLGHRVLVAEARFCPHCGTPLG